jgi:hypothetical protein
MKWSRKLNNISDFSEKLLISLISLLIGCLFVPEQAYLAEHLREFFNLPQTSLIGILIN